MRVLPVSKKPPCILPDPIPLPPHVYVPGKSERHPEDWFDALKADVIASAPTESRAWEAGLHYFQAGYFWECHEVLEAVWMALPDGPEREVCQAVIQLANARLKLLMNRPKAALRLCEMVHGLLDKHGGNRILELDVDRLLGWEAGTRENAQKLQKSASN